MTMTTKTDPLPARRRNQTIKLRRPDGIRVFITLGYYDDGRVGEVFIDVSKPGSELKETLIALGCFMSMNLQAGMKIDSIIEVLEDMSTDGLLSAIARAIREAIENKEEAAEITDGVGPVEPNVSFAEAVVVRPEKVAGKRREPVYVDPDLNAR